MSALGHGELPQVNYGLPPDFCLANCSDWFFWASPHGYINGDDPMQMHEAAHRLALIEVVNARHGMVAKAS